MTLRLHFGCLEWSFWWSWDPRGHPTGTWRSRSRFLVILAWFLESLGSHFGQLFLIFQWFGMPKWKTVSRSMLFNDPWMEMMPDCRGCMCYNLSKTDVFERFHFSHFFTKLVPRGVVLGAFFVTFVDLWHTFSDFWGSWGQAWNLMIFKGYPGGAQVESSTPSEGNTPFCGLQKTDLQTPDCWKADTR